MEQWIMVALIAFGTVFILLAALGIMRMPDLFLRISVTTKAATLGIGLILAGAAIHFGTLGITSRVMAIILFILLTAPVGAHLLGRASYITGTKLWERSVVNEFDIEEDPNEEDIHETDHQQ